MLGNAEKYVVAVARVGSFTQAAKNLYVSQPAISKQISLMEKKLGYALFDRSTRRVHLTARGKIIYEALVSCCEVWETATESARRLETGNNPSLRIGVLNGWSSYSYSLSSITAFQKHFDDIDVAVQQFTYRELTKKLLEQKLDIILTSPAEIPADSNISSTYAFTEELVLYLAKNHPLSRHSSLPEDFGGIKAFVMDQEASLGSLSYVGECIKQHGWNLKLVGLPNVDTIYTAVEHGKGCGFTLANSRVCKSAQYKVYNTGIKEDLYLAWNLNNYSSSIHRFLQFVKEYAG